VRILVIGAVLCFMACGNKPTVSREQAVSLAIQEASRRESVTQDTYDTEVESEAGNWVVKFKPKRHGKGGSIWIHVDQKIGSVVKTQFWQ